MQTETTNPNTLWKYSDLARYLQVSEVTLRRHVMNREIPYLKIGRSIRFDKNQIAEHFNIEILKEITEDKISVKPISNKHHRDFITEILTWLREKSTHFPYSEIDIRLIIHEGKIKRIERTVVEKLLENEVSINR
jgi:excisionase family DNA binding protein